MCCELGFGAGWWQRPVGSKHVVALSDERVAGLGWVCWTCGNVLCVGVWDCVWGRRPIVSKRVVCVRCCGESWVGLVEYGVWIGAHTYPSTTPHHTPNTNVCALFKHQTGGAAAEGGNRQRDVRGLRRANRCVDGWMVGGWVSQRFLAVCGNERIYIKVGRWVSPSPPAPDLVSIKCLV